MNLTLNSSVRLTELDIRKDKKHFIIEDKTSGEFYEIPEVCVTAINLINKGEQLDYISEELIKMYPNEKIDLLEFVQQLLELDLIIEIDGQKIEINKKKSSENQGFIWISPKLGKFFFNKLSYYFYLILFILSSLIFLTKPTLFPSYEDLFISNYMSLNILSWMLLSGVSLIIHEFGHILAMRAKNLPTKLEIGHRLFLVVLETDMTPGWKLPVKSRNGLYLAGVCFDIVILSFSLFIQLIWSSDTGVFINIIRFAVLDTCIRIAYQFFFYMKTDIYFLIESLTGCYNLMENAKRLLNKSLLKRSVKIDDENIFDNERKVVVLYSIFYVTGVMFSIILFIFYYFRQLLFAWKHILPGFEMGIKSVSFWDASLFTLQNVIFISLLLYSWRKKYLQKAL